MEFLVALITAFALVVPVELPDKTFVATLVLATRYSPGPVWIGVTLAFGVQCLVAVAAGRLVALLPARPVHLVAAGLFAVGAVLLFRSAGRAAAEEREREEEFERRVGHAKRSGVRAALASFGVLFVAEWGDLSQRPGAHAVREPERRAVRRRGGVRAPRGGDRDRRLRLTRPPARTRGFSDRGQTVTRQFPHPGRPGSRENRRKDLIIYPSG